MASWVRLALMLRFVDHFEADAIRRMNAGERLTYTIVVDNLGPSWAHEVTLRDELVSSKRFSVLAVDPDVLGNRPSASCGPAVPILDIDQRQTDRFGLGGEEGDGLGPARRRQDGVAIMR